jgi:peptide/nickel transport system substrate-binding protein
VTVMLDQPDFSRSRAILIGTANYKDTWFTPLPAAANSLSAMRDVLTDPDLCGWPTERVTLLRDPTDASRQLQTLRRLSRQTDEVLLLYFVGHGIILPRGHLCLTVADTESEDPDITGLEYQRVREALLDSPARVKIVILDCCYSGRVIEALSGDIADCTETRGVYTLTASDNVAHVLPLEQQNTAMTSFTGELIELIRDGIVDETELLSLGTIYVHLRRRLERGNLPTPNQRATDTAARFPFTRNAAHRPTRTAPQPTPTSAEPTAPPEPTPSPPEPITARPGPIVVVPPPRVLETSNRGIPRSAVRALVASILLVAVLLVWITLPDNGGSNPTAVETTTSIPSSHAAVETTSTPASNAAIGKLFNPSDRKGGTLRVATSRPLGSLDPGNATSPFVWNLARTYGRSLTTFRAVPGAAGHEIVPDLAETLGQPSQDGRVWTYRLRKGVRFEDGTEVKAKDVKYAVARSLDTGVLSGAPTYLSELLDLQGYPGPYKNRNLDDFTAVSTPDDYTVVFHLKRSYSAFDTLATLPQTIPVPQAKDTGTKYSDHVISTGPYIFADDHPGKSFTLRRNLTYDPSTDLLAGRMALPDFITVQLDLSKEEVDKRLLAGDIDLAADDTGLAISTEATVSADEDLRIRADTGSLPQSRFTVINQDIQPLSNVNCRKAIILAADHSGYQIAYLNGRIATSLLPPIVPGSQNLDPYNINGKAQGNVEAARQELVACGRPNGFDLTVYYRHSDNQDDRRAAESLTKSLGRIGIKATLWGDPRSRVDEQYANARDFAKANGIGLIVTDLRANWNDGYGLLAYIVDGWAISAAGDNAFGAGNPAIDDLIRAALNEPNPSARDRYWGDIDRKVMDDALILPGLWPEVTHFRPANLTNVFYNPNFGMYDLTAIGTDRG